MKIHFGNQLRKARIAAGLSQSKLGKTISLSGNSVARIERGEQGIGWNNFERLCGALEIAPTYFFSDNEPKIEKRVVSVEDALKVVREALAVPGAFEQICIVLSSTPTKLK